jgi:hypothetical protein
MTDMLLWPTKDPNEVLDYQIDWSEVLDVDSITSSTWINIATGITIVATANTSTRTVVWLSGGSDGGAYKMTNRVTTSAGRIMDQTIRIEVWEK